MIATNKPAAAPTLSQAQVELATGFSREVLRKWEIRFGFPRPTRDLRERRLYSVQDVQRLQLIKQLLHQGHRPRNVLPLTVAELSRLMASNTAAVPNAPSPLASALLALLTGSPTPAKLDAFLRARLKEVGLEVFAMNDLPVLNDAVGNGWACGGLGVHEEHLYTASVRRIMQVRVAQVRVPPHAPRIVLTTPPGELHELGVLMLLAALSARGAECIDLGVQTPAESVVNAVRKWDVSVVCISIGISFPAATALAYVTALRSLLPADRHLWVGGQGAKPIADAPPVGVSVFDRIEDAVAAWDNTFNAEGAG